MTLSKTLRARARASRAIAKFCGGAAARLLIRDAERLEALARTVGEPDESEACATQAGQADATH